MAFGRIDSYYHQIGRVASAWASLEFTMDYLIWQLAKAEQKAGTCITSQLPGATARLRCIVALLHLREIPEELVKKFRSFEGSMQPLLIQRNRIIHDTWAYDGQSRIVQLRLAITRQKVASLSG
jgi:hypothetical protein